MIHTAILRTLDNVRPSRLMSSVLLAEVRLAGVACGEHELAAALRALLDARMIDCLRDALTGDTYYRIEPAGIARLREGK